MEGNSQVDGHPFVSMEAKLIPWNLPWTFVETSVQIDRKGKILWQALPGGSCSCSLVCLVSIACVWLTLYQFSRVSITRQCYVVGKLVTVVVTGAAEGVGWYAYPYARTVYGRGVGLPGIAWGALELSPKTWLLLRKTRLCNPI